MSESVRLPPPRMRAFQRALAVAFGSALCSCLLPSVTEKAKDAEAPTGTERAQTSEGVDAGPRATDSTALKPATMDAGPGLPGSPISPSVNPAATLPPMATQPPAAVPPVNSACAPNNGGCEQLCDSDKDKPVCACEPGGLLDSDGKQCRGWSTPQGFETGDYLNHDLKAAFGGDDSVLVVWSAPTMAERNGQFVNYANFQLLANRFNADNGWGAAVPLAAPESAGVVCSALSGLNARGEALILSSYYDKPLFARALTGAQWSPPVPIQAKDLEVVSVQECVATMDAMGNGLAIYMSSGGLLASRWMQGRWTIAEPIDPSIQTRELRLAVAQSGNALLLWNDNTKIRSKRFSPSGGWTATSPVGNEAKQHARPVFAMSARGDAVGVWSVADVMSSEEKLEAAMFKQESGWGSPTTVGDFGLIPLQFPHAVAVNDMGAALVVWNQTPSDGLSRYVASRFEPNKGWSAPELISTPGLHAVVLPASVALEPSGSAIVTWTQPDEGHMVAWGNRFLAGTGWVGPGRIGTRAEVSGDAGETHVAIDTKGRPVATWNTYDRDDAAKSRIWVSHWE